VVLDVRTPEEIRRRSHSRFHEHRFQRGGFQQKIGKLDKDKTYLVHCASGGRSARACNQLGKLELKNLYNLEGGMGAWRRRATSGEK